MKTRSKRFLNLATLCLALLGTILLVTQPVKAGELERGGDRVGDQERDDPYQRGVREGHDAGYKRGKQDRQQNGSPDAFPTPPDRVPEPKSNPYTTESDKKRYKNGWDTAYLSSYHTGWYDGGTGHLESDGHPNEEEEGDISDNPSSQDSTDSTDDSFSSIIDMIVEVTQLLWGLVSNWF
ncbi:Uncharacterised protein [Streptococcus pyogenes]|uniref:hypothetical protein n=1 Tax=Streptococcus pyogenes TaxID=1314 RepID=UPI0010A1E0A9|nr:hypothetical protein [Streptococcus pyogenes]VHB32734.1 Uncharacterised protein [Streptococcus pyogenes]